ncbi:MAG: hypothetical protein ACAH07_09635 [Methylophilaceae bacterium]|nr:hypothetical protein [Methyloradius sp.]
MRSIKQPNLYFRSAYFIDSLKAKTGLTFTTIEERVRREQYEKHGLQAPATETVRDYFRLKRAVAFESDIRNANKFPSWLMAVEMEFPLTSYAFFHPLFDLLFSRVESSSAWMKHFERIPEQWILEVESQGRAELAAEWRGLNASSSKRLHTKKSSSQIDRLSLVHLLMIRTIYREVLFEKNGLSSYFKRRYLLAEEELNSAVSENSLDALFILLALTEEAALIGDAKRFEICHSAFLNSLGNIHEYEGCEAIAAKILPYIHHHLNTQVNLRQYHFTDIEGLGLPVTWKSTLVGERLFRNDTDQ